MKYNKWTLGLMAVGAVSFASATAARAVEANMNRVETALSGISISGCVDTSIEWGLEPSGSDYQSSPGNFIPFRGTTKQDGFNLNVVRLSIEKPLDESEYASGFKVDLLFGPDAVAYNPSANGNGTDEFGIKQAYVALRAPIGNGLVLKVGTFDTLIGYEVFDSASNPNFTRSWGYSIEPTSHTGILASYQFSDAVSVSGGVANTLSTGINARYTQTDPVTGGLDTDRYWNKTWLGLISLTAPESWGSLAGSALYVGAVTGFNGSDDQWNLYAGAVVNTPVEGLTAGIAYDYTDRVPAWIGTVSDTVDISTLGLYASYKATDKLSFHARGEYGWFNALPGVDGCFYSLTGTVQYDLWANVVTRIELRYDSAEDLQAAGLINEDESILLAANIVYKF